MKLEDKTTGELFAKCPIDKYPGLAVESVSDSSRYFVVRIQDDGEVSGRSAFIGIGFADRSDSFDLNVALQDHFKWVEKSEKIEAEEKSTEKPQLDLSFKEGQTIRINIGQKSASTSRPKPKNSAPGILPPPGGMKIAPPPSAAPRAPSPCDTSPIPTSPENNNHATKLLDLDLLSAAPAASQNAVPTTTGDIWGDFASAAGATATSSAPKSASSSAADDWVQF